MARLRDLQKKVSGDSKIKQYAALTILLETLDAFVLKKNENEIILTAYVHLMKQEFKSISILELLQPLGKWLCGLPKGVWNDKANKQ